jgi:hypothetical protein
LQLAQYQEQLPDDDHLSDGVQLRNGASPRSGKPWRSIIVVSAG